MRSKLFLPLLGFLLIAPSCAAQRAAEEPASAPPAPAAAETVARLPSDPAARAAAIPPEVPQAADPSPAPGTGAGAASPAAAGSPPERPPRGPRARSGRGGADQGYEFTTWETLPREPSWFEVEARARAAFIALPPDVQREVCDYLEAELRGLSTFQATLVHHVLAGQERDPGLWPDYQQPRWFDPEVHAPAQPIPRQLLEPSDPEVQGARRQILGNVAPRRARSGWTYDYGTRELARLPDESDPLRIFDNALLGLPPRWDLVEALVEQRLDDGSLQKTFQAFGHAYTDREGGVYPGLTLYDAWTSRTGIEMPDVDNLGIVHHALGDWETWKSVVPSSAHPALYGRIGELYQEAFHHRSLRHNLARAYVAGTTELRDGYQHNLDRFHALWESASSDPARLAERLPAPAAWAAFLQGWADEIDADQERFLRGVNRRYTLDRDAGLVRQTLLRVLEELGAYRRLDEAGERQG